MSGVKSAQQLFGSYFKQKNYGTGTIMACFDKKLESARFANEIDIVLSTNETINIIDQFLQSTNTSISDYISISDSINIVKPTLEHSYENKTSNGYIDFLIKNVIQMNKEK